MSSGMPELGSKISLISKADIRYEGRLFTVDPQECTIALANVRSFGTEDRETQFPVAPQNQVYEYILFRGSDIKDIRVVNTVSSIPNDPAIVQMTVPPSIGQQPYQQQASYALPVLNQLNAVNSQYTSPYGMTMTPIMGSTLQGRQGADKQTSVLEIISGGSRSTTPTPLITRKSPTMDQGIQVGQLHQQQIQTVINKINDKQGIRNLQTSNERDSYPIRRSGSGLSQYTDVKRDNEKTVMQGNISNPSQSQTSHGQNIRGNRGSWINSRGGVRGRGTRGGRAQFRSSQPISSTTKTKNTLKFENDYDFEQANTKFEELRLQLSKAKIDGHVENEKKDDSGNETGAGDGEPEEESEVIHYDKSKSFFDNISCEAVERSKGRSQRTDWRTERKLNSETFGVASTRRGGFRGRGYYTRGMASSVYHNNVSIPAKGLQHSGYRGGYRGNRTNNRKISCQAVNGTNNQTCASNESPSSHLQQNKRLVANAT